MSRYYIHAVLEIDELYDVILDVNAESEESAKSKALAVLRREPEEVNFMQVTAVPEGHIIHSGIKPR